MSQTETVTIQNRMLSLKVDESCVKDIGLAEWGRKEIELAEVEMPGLMACRAEFSAEQPLRGAKISGSLHMTIQTAVLIETLKALGAEVRWCSCNIFSTQDQAAAAIAQKKSAIVYAWKGETLDEYWACTEAALTWPGNDGPDLIVDDGGDATLLIHKGMEAEQEYCRTGVLPQVVDTDDADTKSIKKLLSASIQANPSKFTKMAKHCKGVSEETTTGVHRLLHMEKEGSLLFPAYNVNDCVTKSKFDNIYGCRHSMPDALNRAVDQLMSGRKVVVCGYGQVGRGIAAAMNSGSCCSRVYVTEIDPINALQAAMEGYEVIDLDDPAVDLSTFDCFITATGNRDIIRLDHMQKMKNNAIVCNCGHFDNEIQMAELENFPNARRVNIKPQVDRFVFAGENARPEHGIIVLSEGRLANLGNATGHPSFVMSCSFTCQTLAQLALWKAYVETGKPLPTQVYLLPKVADEKVARLHLPMFNAKLTTLTQKQVDYIHIPAGGPYKPSEYRY